MIKLPGAHGEVMVWPHKVECLKRLHENKQTAVITDSGVTLIIDLPIEAVYAAMQEPVKEMLRAIADEVRPLNG